MVKEVTFKISELGTNVTSSSPMYIQLKEECKKKRAGFGTKLDKIF